MQTNVNTTIERIIAKIDNDFNPDNSDWIPRVGAWCIDAMNILGVTATETITKKFKVHDRIAYIGCDLSNTNFKVTDANGCRIKEADESQQCCDFSTGGQNVTETAGTSNTTEFAIDDNAKGSTHVHAELINTKGLPNRYNVIGSRPGSIQPDKNYVLVDCDKIELNFDTDYIILTYKGIKTEHSKAFGCELPVIPNNGLLIEAIVYFCMYKMLTRGYKHPVFNLNASQYGTNPYFIWTQLKDEAQRSTIINSQGDVIDDGGLWHDSFILSTFRNSQK